MISLLGIPISIEPESELLNRIESSIGQGKGLCIITPNPEILVEAVKNPLYSQALRQADIALPDGTGVVLALRFLGQAISRIPGRIFFVKLLELAEKNKWSVYLLGSTERSLSTSLARIGREYPSIKANGTAAIEIHENGLPTDEAAEQQILERIEKEKPKLLFVAFGHPKQEVWVTRVKARLPGTTIMTIGGSLDTYSGVVPRPPQLMSSLGLEWLFRLFTQPKRAKRMVTALIVFPWLVVTHR